MIAAEPPRPLAPATFRAWRWPMWPMRGAQRHISRRIVSLIRRVVEREGGCVAWGGAVNLSPADDILIRVERALDLDTEGHPRRRFGASSAFG
jgi:hypothetical protein